MNVTIAPVYAMMIKCLTGSARQNNALPPLKRIVTGLLICLIPLSTTAQIFRCVNADGRPSFSDTPCPDTAVKGNSPAHTLWREMRQLVAQGHSINKQLGADAQSIVQCQRSAASYANKLESVNDRLIKLSTVTHKHLFKAMDYIRSCGQCRVSAAYDCKKASTQLDEQMNVLMKLEREKTEQASKESPQI